MFIFSINRDTRYLPVLSHSFPTRRSSDLQFDFACATEDGLARSAVYRDHIDAIAVMVGILNLLRAALDRDRPSVDQLLSRPFLRRQLGLLQRVADRAVVLIMGDVFDA